MPSSTVHPSSGPNGQLLQSVLIITPTYNERENLPVFVREVQAVIPEASILVIDDNSPDGTGSVADQLARSDARLHVLHRPRKLGIGSAYLEGFRWALKKGFEHVVQMDTDLSHDPAHLPTMLDTLERADLALGSRNIDGGRVEGWGPGRHLLSKGGSLYSRAILGLPVRDLTSGFKAFRAAVLRSMDLDTIRSEGYSFQIEVTHRALLQGFRVHEVPIVFIDRRAGKSKMSAKIFAEAVMRVWKLRWDAQRTKRKISGSAK